MEAGMWARWLLPASAARRAAAAASSVTWARGSDLVGVAVSDVSPAIVRCRPVASVSAAAATSTSSWTTRFLSPAPSQPCRHLAARASTSSSPPSSSLPSSSSSSSAAAAAAAAPRVCPGCGVPMQSSHPDAPGFYKAPTVKENKDNVKEAEALENMDEVVNLDGNNAAKQKASTQQLEEFEIALDDSELKALRAEFGEAGKLDDDDFDETDVMTSSEYQRSSEEFDLALERYWSGGKGSKSSSSSSKGKSSSSRQDGVDKASTSDRERVERTPVAVCARCHALRNYGRVKNKEVEHLLPEFDFEAVVGRRLRRAYGRRAVVVMVVDAADFDGSFPRAVATLMQDAVRENADAHERGLPSNVPRLMLAANKVDLLPDEALKMRLQNWVRHRARQGGVEECSGVYLVSAKSGYGIDDLAEKMAELAGPRGEVWVVGAQNAGKSSLINALAKRAGGGSTKVTEAWLPGTTIGVIKLSGVLPGRAMLLDTPGIIHAHQVTTRLDTEEVLQLLPRKKLKPRTFRVQVGSCVHVGSVARLDVIAAPGSSLYLTLWASADVACHMGKIEGAGELLQNHGGSTLQPPIGDYERLTQLGSWVWRDLQISGDSWKQSTTDISIAGVGWVAVAVAGDATVRVFTYEGVAVLMHEAMLRDMARDLERPGFSSMRVRKGEKPKSKKGKKSNAGDQSDDDDGGDDDTSARSISRVEGIAARAASG